MKFTRDILYIIVIAVLGAVCAQLYYDNRWVPAHSVAVYYNRDRALNTEVIKTIRDADSFIYFAVYTFTREDIKDALIGAKYRGVDVVGITDRNQNSQLPDQKEIVDELRGKGIPVYQQDHSAIMHLKALVTEKAYLSGSYNWTASATNSNDEVLEIGRDEGVRAKYQAVLEELFTKYGQVM